MRGALRRPTGDGVLDPTREFLASALVLCLDSLPKLVLVPLHYPPQGPRAFRRADPFGVVPARFFIKKRIQNFIRILSAFWLPKWFQKPPNMMPKFIKNA